MASGPWEQALLPLDRVAASYAVRVTATVLLTVLVAFSVNLDRPYWGITTAVFMTQDDMGQTIWRGLAQALGLLVGAAAALLFLALFAQEPVPMITALALWLGACAFFARFEAGSDAYAYATAGLTALIVAIDSSPDPLSSIDVAIARFSEISVGILAACIVSIVLFYRSASATLGRLRAEARRDLLRLARTAARGEGGIPVAERQRVTAMMGAIANEQKALALERSWPVARVRASRVAASELLLTFAEIEVLDQRLRDGATRCGGSLRAELKEFGRLLDALSSQPASIDGYLAGAVRAEAFAATLRERRPFTRLLAAGAASGEAEELLALDRLQRVAGAFARFLRAEAGVLDPKLPLAAAPALPARYGDPWAAFANALRSATAFVVMAWFWLATAWPSGLLLTLEVGFLSLTFAVLFPRPVLLKAGRDLALGALAATLPVLAVMAAFASLEGFLGFAAVLGSFLLVAAYLGALLQQRIMVLGAVLLMAFGIQPNNVQVLDPVALLNLLGVLLLVGLVLQFFFGSFLPETPRRIRIRLVAGTRRLLRRAISQGQQPVTTYLSRAFDLLTEYGSGLDLDDPEDRRLIQWARRSILTGGELLRLRRLENSRSLPAPLHAVLERTNARLLQALRGRTDHHCRELAATWHRDLALAGEALRTAADGAIASAAGELILLLLCLRGAVVEDRLAPPIPAVAA